MTDTNRIEQRAREILAAECNCHVGEMRYEAYGVVNTRVALSAIRRALTSRQSVVDDAMVERMARVVATRAGEDYDAIGEFAQTLLKDTQRAALVAAMEKES